MSGSFEIKWISTFTRYIYPSSLIYLGSTRCLKNYDIVQKTENSRKGARPTLLAQIWVSLQVPIYSSIALLAIYFTIKHEYNHLKMVFQGWFLVLGLYSINEQSL